MVDIVEKILVDSPKSKIILLGILPRNDAMSLLKNIKEVNAMLVQKCKEYLPNKIECIDLSHLFMDEKRECVVKELYNDNVHLNSAGYRVFGKELCNIIKKEMM
jgi:lysophospholipase L1-like esterase